MATNPQIRSALLKKLGVTRQRLSQLAKARKLVLPMSTEHALYTIAHEQGVDIAKHLSAAETAQVQQALTALRGRNGGDAAAVARQPGRQKRNPKVISVSIKGFPTKLSEIAGTHAREAKMMAERVYPRLYVFENSLRDVVERVLSAKKGTDWWAKTVPKKIRDTAAKHKAAESKDQWHGKRGDREIDYVFLSQLWDIIKHNWSCFKGLFPNQAWIEALITNDMNVSRRVVAHMNPLGDDDVRNIEAAFRKWVKQIKAVEDELP